jgi:hypothetical protein
MDAPGDAEPDQDRERVQRLGEGYFILGMAVQVGLVGLVGLALVGVQGVGFLTLGTAVALAGLAIGVLAVGTILTLASLRHALNLVYEQDSRLDQLAERVGAISQELRSDEEMGWGSAPEVAPPLGAGSLARGDPRDRRPEPGPGGGPDPLEGGEAHDPSEVPGLAAGDGERLREAGVEDTRDLGKVNTMYVAGLLEASPDDVERWQALARLMAIEGIDGARAARLADEGLGSVEALAHESPERVARWLSGEEAARDVDTRQAQAWIDQARAHVETAEGRPSGEA